MNLTRKIPKTLIILLLAFCTAFLAWAISREYTYFSRPASTPTIIPEPAFAVHIPQKALLKNYVTVSAEAPPGITCELTYISPSGENHQMDAIANSDGLCEWKWKIEESQGKGAGRLIFTINGLSETHFLQILSSF
jgi:hypothetical protein